MKAGRLLCCKSEMLRVSAGLLSRAAASQVLRSSGLRGCFVGARQEANSPPALLCPPQATLRADHLLLWDKKQTTNSSRTASGKSTKQGMWLVGAASFRRALWPWGLGERARRRRRSARRRRRSARSAALSGHLRSRNGLRSGCTPGTEGASKTLKSLLIDGVTGGAPASEKCDCRLC